MKLTVASSLVASLMAGLMFSASAHANDAEGAYFGAGAGWSQYRDLNDVANTGVNRDAFSSRLLGGYTFNEFFGLEAGYDWMGHGKVGDDTYRIDGWTLSALPRYPLSKEISLLGEVGLMRDYATNDDRQTKSHGYSPVFGIGAAYRVNDAVDLQARYRIVDDAGRQAAGNTDVNNLGFEVVYYPTRSSAPAPVVAPAPVAETAAAPAPQEVVETKRFTLTSDVLFDFGKASLKPEGKAALTKLYNEISSLDMKDHQTVVFGYTDRIGSDAANMKLSQQRAQSVVNYLKAQGIAADRITATGRGEANPVTGTTCNGIKNRKNLISCLASDRRVEIEVKGIKEVVVQQ
ncbi:porin OmpA [Pseudaeromonas sharmana]|uniref:Porin OmpA n=1 Tax=Pseudaeromonas sharmana TaxID=328412 RepID=A0ABV8CK46_9GAMM